MKKNKNGKKVYQRARKAIVKKFSGNRENLHFFDVSLLGANELNFKEYQPGYYEGADVYFYVKGKGLVNILEISFPGYIKLPECLKEYCLKELNLDDIRFLIFIDPIVGWEFYKTDYGDYLPEERVEGYKIFAYKIGETQKIEILNLVDAIN